MGKEELIYEDEIDLKELIITIWRKKVFILFFTVVVTILAVIYVFIKTPIYEVKSVVRVGYIGENLVEDSKILEKKLRLIFNVDSKKNIIEKNKPIVSNISSVNKVDNFIEVSTQGYSNKEALEKNKEVITFLQTEYKAKIDEYILRTNMIIKNIEEKIAYVNDVEKVNTQKDIEKIKTQDISKIENQINLLKTVDLKIIENKLKFNKEKLKEYEDNLSKISKRKSSDNTQNMLMAMQILNIQNLILNIQNTIENLKREKEKILDITIKNLEIEKENLINDDIRKLNIHLNIDITNKINDLKDKLQLEKLKLTNDSVKNSEIVGSILTDENPVKPKKKLIIAVAFVTGFILSIFLVFFMEFVNSIKKEEEDNK